VGKNPLFFNFIDFPDGEMARRNQTLKMTIAGLIYYLKQGVDGLNLHKKEPPPPLGKVSTLRTFFTQEAFGQPFCF
jgi:hypothetical protein